MSRLGKWLNMNVSLSGILRLVTLDDLIAAMFRVFHSAEIVAGVFKRIPLMEPVSELSPSQVAHVQRALDANDRRAVLMHSMLMVLESGFPIFENDSQAYPPSVNPSIANSNATVREEGSAAGPLE